MQGPRNACPLLLAFIFWFSSASGNDCSFEDKHDQYDPERAVTDAETAAEEGQFRFIGVADGMVPSRPGFEGLPMSRCLMLEVQWEMLWVGADSTSCKNGNYLKRKATEYAKLFNTAMLALAAADPSFRCATDVESLNEEK